MQLNQQLTNIFFNKVKNKNVTQKQQQYYQNIVQSNTNSPNPINLNGLQTQFLNQNQHFKLLFHKIQTYNQNIHNMLRNAQLDLWRDSYYDTLSSCLSDISLLDNRDVQVKQLQQLKNWSQQKDKQLRQKTQDPGKIRYKNYLSKRKKLSITPSTISQSPFTTFREEQSTRIQKEQQELDLPSTRRMKHLSQYDKHTRTCHPESIPPQERLQQYKRKQLSMVGPKMSLRKMKQTKKQQLRAVYTKSIKQQKVPEKEQQAPKQIQILKENQQPKDQDLGFGMDQQPFDQLPLEQPKQDRLAPKNKPFISPIQQPSEKNQKDVEIRGNFKHYVPYQSVFQQEMEQRRYANTLKQLQQKKQDQEIVQLMQTWACKKAKTQKQLQRRLEVRKFIPTTVYVEQGCKNDEAFSIEDQRKYFPLSDRLKEEKKNAKLIDASFALPKISSQIKQNKLISKQRINPIQFQKSYARSRINSLKKEYGQILNIPTQPFQKDPLIPRSLCQQTKRNKSFSQVLQQHSVDAQRQSQYEQIKKIKQRLAKYKVGLNVKMVSDGICIPNCEMQQKQLPQPNLLSNPFMQVKKKKKKKK